MGRNVYQVNEHKTVLGEGEFIRLVREHGWEYAERHNCTGIIIVIALTDDGKVILTEQYRLPVRKKVIEFCAGLVNDLDPKKSETLQYAARRELLEETGYKARKLKKIMDGPVSAGFSSNLVTMFLAIGVKKVADGGGDETENITVHEVPLEEADRWLARKQKQGVLVDPKVYAGIYFLKQSVVSLK